MSRWSKTIRPAFIKLIRKKSCFNVTNCLPIEEMVWTVNWIELQRWRPTVIPKRVSIVIDASFDTFFNVCLTICQTETENSSKWDLQKKFFLWFLFYFLSIFLTIRIANIFRSWSIWDDNATDCLDSKSNEFI